MTTPREWLTCPTTLEIVEEELSTEGASDLWLLQWREFRCRVCPDDELWEYEGVSLIESDAADDPGLDACRAGYALVRGGEIVDSIPAFEN